MLFRSTAPATTPTTTTNARIPAAAGRPPPAAGRRRTRPARCWRGRGRDASRPSAPSSTSACTASAASARPTSGEDCISSRPASASSDTKHCLPSLYIFVLPTTHFAGNFFLYLEILLSGVLLLCIHPTHLAGNNGYISHWAVLFFFFFLFSLLRRIGWDTLTDNIIEFQGTSLSESGAYFVLAWLFFLFR